MKRVLLAGYFGCGNIGDDAILLGFLEGARDLDIDPIVMSGRPEETHRLYGVPGFDRRDLGLFKERMAEADLLVFPGGSIFQDVTSLRSVAYYSSLVKTAKKLGKKVVLLGQGMGPLNRFVGKKLAKDAFNACDAICVRDPDSIQTLKKLGVKQTPHLTADMALLLPKPTIDDNVESYQVAGMRGVALIPRPHGKGDGVAQLFGEIAQQLMKQGRMPVLIEMDRHADRPLILQIEKLMGGKIPTIRDLVTPMAMMSKLCRLEGMISMRLHGGILSAAIGVPPTMLSYDPKVTALSKLLGLPSALPMDGLTASRAVDSYLELQKKKATYGPRMEGELVQLRDLAAKNIEVLRRIL